MIEVVGTPEPTAEEKETLKEFFAIARRSEIDCRRFERYAALLARKYGLMRSMLPISIRRDRAELMGLV